MKIHNQRRQHYSPLPFQMRLDQRKWAQYRRIYPPEVIVDSPSPPKPVPKLFFQQRPATGLDDDQAFLQLSIISLVLRIVPPTNVGHLQCPMSLHPSPIQFPKTSRMKLNPC